MQLLRNYLIPVWNNYRLLYSCIAKRERFYAGEEAGWGAQVMKYPMARLCLFLFDSELDLPQAGRTGNHI